MSTPDRRLTPDDLDACDWQLTRDPDDPTHRYGLHHAYFERFQQVAPFDPCHHVFALLNNILGLVVNNSVDEPFVPKAMLDAVNHDDLRVLASRAADINDPDVRTRVRDLSWVINRDHQAGIAAIGDYLEAANGFAVPKSWILYFTHLQRALHLGKSLGNQDAIAKVVESIEAFIRDYDIAHDARFIARDLMQALLDARAGDVNELAGEAHRIASEAEGSGEWDRAEAHWEMEAKHCDRLQATEPARLARVRAAESHISAAREEAAKGAPFTGVAASGLLEAVKMLQAAGERRQADVIYQEALELQQIARTEAQPFSIEVDLTEPTDRARTAVRDKELLPALAELAALIQPLRVDWLRAQTEEHIEQFPIQHLIQQRLGDERGRTVARRPSRGDGNERDDERAMQADMFANAKFYRGGYVAMAIDPARRQILSEHQSTVQVFLDLVAVAPFVPTDRERLFARGLLAGLQGDWVTATHLLVPQMEYAIRRVFEQNGVLTSTLDQEHAQEDRTLGVLLQDARFHEAGRAIFGNDLLFDMRGLLVEEWGGNLRNRVSHGLMSDTDFEDVQCQYLWWLALRFVMWPHLVDLSAQARSQSSSSRESADASGLTGT